ncbi:2OG-Fe(II) oxygenase superfamily protein [Schizosaccharomyces cryophilus OY26]|uniref:2OG-Fe(II) oxygenase superfamily protein n=1 Tax=Schizosaccharomyces cryophilus (strain OY26 / ATCC MYA-4695 / CBS 11777 / NBRC 106824 / NRRL Y48691) TaxID=653667 RepID=S9W841_SCHCR|nr:2OG-Fe(II) oxygenase superfamily protein [Schizosaccharomyces cryophilus OY26]EPY53895.1 2OG-Fe(II) oxygenase superfamily protein [Schizosaccharomyces cryophilus OY26]
MESLNIPFIDLSEQNTSLLSMEVVNACKEWGFFMVKNHGIDIEQMEGVFKVSDEFFNLPVEEKKHFLFKGGELQAGYSIRMGEKLYSDDPSTGAVKEFYDLARFPHSNPSVISPPIRKFLPEMTLFQKQCYSLSLKLLDLIALGFELPSDFFTKCHSSAEDFIRLIKYSVPEGMEHKKDDVDTDCHFDYGTITLLIQRKYGFLQIKPPGGNIIPDWVRVSFDKDVISVNIADMLPFLTRGKVKSSIHQVKIDPEMRKGQMIAYSAIPDLDYPLTQMSDEQDGKNAETTTVREYKEKRLNDSQAQDDAPT